MLGAAWLKRRLWDKVEKCGYMVDYFMRCNVHVIAINIITVGLAVAFIHHPCIFAKTVVSLLSGSAYHASPHHFNVS